MSNKNWKSEAAPSNRLEIENNLMEERLNQMKNEFVHDKEKRNAMGGTIWSTAQPGPVKGYAKSFLKPSEEQRNILNKINKPSNRQIKLQILKDEVLSKKISSLSAREKEKKFKCGQCEKNMAFTRCLDCNEDYCANCFTSFHLKGALQRHRTTAIPKDGDVSVRSAGSRQESALETTHLTSDGDSNCSSELQFAGLPKAKKENKKSLLNGEYNEKEANESFQKALLDWRKENSDNKRNGQKRVQIVREHLTFNEHSRDAIINTDLTEDEKQRRVGIRQLESYITSNHSLSYADRMLLQKFRANQLEFCGEIKNEKSSTPELDRSIRETINLAHSQHINFDSLKNGLDVDRNNRDSVDPNSMRHIEETYIGINEIEPFRKPNNSIQIEEISTDIKKGSFKNSQSYNTSLMPELMNANLQQSLDLNIRESFQSKKSFYTNSRPNSARSGGAKTPKPKHNDQNKEKQKLPSNLSKIQASDALRQIAMRNGSISREYDSGITGFLTLDVNNQDENDTHKKDNIQRPTSSRCENTKLSFKFYTMSPRSWNPLQSQAVSESTNQNVKKISNPPMSNSPEIKKSTELNVKREKTPIIQEKEINNKTIANNADSVNTLEPRKNNTPIGIKVSSSANFSNKHADDTTNTKNKPPMPFNRNKSFHSSIQTKKVQEPKRPATAREKISRPASRINTRMSTEFIKYDGDDGRSSKVFQNEEDSNYYGELEKEFQIVSQSGFNEGSLNENINSIIQSETKLQDLSDSFSKSLQLLESTLKNEQNYDVYENSDLESMILEEEEEVKQLK